MANFNPEVIRSSFEIAKPIAKDVADKFYEILFEDYPQAKGLFNPSKMDGQKKALIGGLVFIVDHLEDSEKLVGYLHKLGARHAGYKVEDEHYSWVGSSLLKTLKFFFKDDWTSELHNNWASAYKTIATLMIEGAKEASQNTPAPTPLNVLPQALEVQALQMARQVLENALIESLDEDFEKLARKKIYEVLQIALEKEFEDLQQKLKHKTKAAA